MKNVSVIDFKRAIRAYCRENNLELTESGSKGPTESLTISLKSQSNQIRVISITIRSDKPNLGASIGRKIVERTRIRVQQEAERQAVNEIVDRLTEFADFISKLF